MDTEISLSIFIKLYFVYNFKGLKFSFLFSWSRTRDMIISTTAIVTVAVGREAVG